MARAKVTHSDDAVQITFYGNPLNPEPGTAVIKFPGGHVEVSRCTDGSYWAHIEVDDPLNIQGSRIDYDHEAGQRLGVPKIPEQNHIKKLAVRVGVK